MSGSLPGLALVPACVGMAVAWTWVVATLFVGQELAMHDTSQSCMLGGAAAALAVFAMLDLAGTRGPELNRRLMRVLSCLVAGLIVVDIYLPGNPSLPAPLIAGAWMLLGVFGAYAIRRSFHLLASLATRLSGRSILRVACACLAGAAVLSLMASNMQVREAAVVMVASVPAALWLLPQGRLMLGRKRRGTDTRTGNDGAGAPPTNVGGAKNPSAQAHSCSDLRLRQLAPYAFTFIAMGFTCGFHTSVGRVLYLDYEHFSLVFFSILTACILCACLAKRPSFARQSVPAIALQVPLACSCVAFVPLLFLSDRPDNALWELVQNTLAFLSSWSLLVSITLLTCADASTNKTDVCAAPYCAAGVATFALGLFIGWLIGQNSFAQCGASGLAFRLGVTVCIALLVSSLLAASTHMAQGNTEPLTTAGGDNSRQADITAGPFVPEGTGRTAAPISEQANASEEQAPASPMSNDGVAVCTGRTDSVNAILTGQAGMETADQAVKADSAPYAQALARGAHGVGGARLSSPEAVGITASSGAPHNPVSSTRANQAAIETVALHFGLSGREHVLLTLLAEGLTAQQAADRLTVSRNTVKSHMAHIYAKCNVHTRTELDELLDTAGEL